MAREYIYVAKGVEVPIAIAPNFTQEELHGLKTDIRNSVPDVHKMDVQVVSALQIIKQWSILNFPQVQGGIPMKVSSTLRTYTFDQAISPKEGGIAGAHTFAIAVDWKFIGDYALEATKKFNTEIRDKGALWHELRKIGVNGVGLYGPAAPTGKNFCHIDTRSKDTLNLPRNQSGAPYENWSFWTVGNPLYSDSAPSEDESFNDSDQLINPITESCVEIATVTEGLSTGQEMFFEDKVGEGSSYFNDEVTAKDLLNYKYEDKNNRERLFDALTFEDQVKYSGNTDGSYNANADYPFEVGAVVYFPCEWLKNTQHKGGDTPTSTESGQQRSDGEITIGATMTQSHTNESFPYPPLLSFVTQDPGFKPANKDRNSQHTDFYPQATVLGWSRALDLGGGNPIVNLTADIIAITTQSDMEAGGSFSIEIAPILADHNDFYWIKRGDVSIDDTQSFNLSMINEEVTRIQSEVIAGEERGTQFSETTYDTYTQFYYEKIFQQNDALFIKFEQLNIDSSQEEGGILADHWYDMMCLVDRVTVNRTAQGTAVSITITGRDYQKALVDESGYTNPYSIGGVASMFGEQANLVSPRSFDGGIFQYRTVELLQLNKIIEFSMYALISNEFVPSKVFEDNWAYRDRNHLYLRSERGNLFTQREIEEFSLDNPTDFIQRTYTLRGIWQKIRFWIDPQVAEYVVYDDSISQPEGSIWQHFQKICQKPYVEVFTETVGDWFYIIVRRPPFTRISYQKILSATSPSNSQPQTYRQWKDALNRIEPQDPTNPESVKSYLANASDVESIEDYLAQISEERVNEFRALNYEEQLKELNIIQNQSGYSDFNTFPAVVQIHPRDVTSESLTFKTDVFTWFEVDTRGLYQGTGGPFGMPIPAVYFQELAQIYGSKRMSISTNYIDVHSIRDGGEDARKKQDLLEKEIAQLLGYIIETHVYLPFTREGSITLANGDRRIKKGTFIYHQATDEIFYVTGVTHQLRHTNGAIHRNTTIRVDRGMIVPYITGREESVVDNDGNESDEVVSYFNIVDLPKVTEEALDAVNSVSNLDVYDQKKPATMNQGVLNFFLERRQFLKK